MSAITVDDKLIHYEKLGRGRPVILLHGWLGSWRYWVPLMQVIHTQFNVYALDLVGFGDSAKAPASYSADQQARILHGILDNLGIPKAAFIGHGLGALVAIEFAAQYPDRVARMMLISAPVLDPGDLATRRPPAPAPSVAGLAGQAAQSTGALAQATRQQESQRNLTDSDRQTLYAAAEQVRVRRQTGELPPLDADDRPLVLRPAIPAARQTETALHRLLLDQTPEALLARCFRRNDPSYAKLKLDIEKSDPEAVRRSLEGYDPGRLLDTLYATTIPSVLVHGLDDPIVPAPSDEVWSYVTGNTASTIVPIVLPGIRHFPMLEHEPFGRLAGDFLAATDLSRLEVRERWRRRSR
jgi:pimeloyl-ACP methyl ester carboxylesterase